MEEPKDTPEETAEGVEAPEEAAPKETKDTSSILAYSVFGGLFILMMVAVLLISLWDDIGGSSPSKHPTATPTQVVEVTATPTATVAPVTVSFDAPAEAEERERFSVMVTITDVTDFDTGEYEISYDPEVLNVVDVLSGEIDGVDILIEDWGFVPSGEQGTVQISHRAGGDSWASGAGYLAEVKFKVVGDAGDTGDIDFVDGSGEMQDKEANEIPAAWSGVTVTVID